MNKGVLDPSEIVPWVLTDYVEENIGPNSYDLRVEKVFEIQGGITLYRDGRRKLPDYKEVSAFSIFPNKFFRFVPGVLYQVEFKEQIKMPLTACGITLMRSSMHKSGASGEPGLYDSGYQGSCGISVSVKHPSVVEVGASIAQMVFLSAEATTAYDGHYSDASWRERLVKE